MKRFSFVVALLLVCTVWFTGCTSQQPADTSNTTANEPVEEASENAYSIAFLNFNNAHPYFQSGKARAIETAAELGVKLAYDGPADVDTPKFINMVEDYTSKGVDLLIVAPLDDTSAPVMQEARAKGVKVITWDVDVNIPAARDLYVSLAYDVAESIGVGMAEAMVKNLGPDGGDIIWIDGEPSNEYIAQRRTIIKDYWAKNYPNIVVVGEEAAGEDLDKAYTVAQSLLTAYPNVKGIMCNGASSFGPACKVVEEYGLIGKCFVSGEVTPSIARPGLLSGASKCGFTWDTADWTEFCVRVGVEFLKGTDMPEGSLANLFPMFPKSERKGDILFYGEGVYLTAENIDDFGDW
ncbi:MAG: substrate-binding domain-containing protein [Oscillospiraceae bacterium]|nr:substrate-binding domain-containing protein [Oscillospiraceae bacterium]